jgi:hypothetical protein
MASVTGLTASRNVWNGDITVTANFSWTNNTSVNEQIFIGISKSPSDNPPTGTSGLPAMSTLMYNCIHGMPAYFSSTAVSFTIKNSWLTTAPTQAELKALPGNLVGSMLYDEGSLASSYGSPYAHRSVVDWFQTIIGGAVPDKLYITALTMTSTGGNWTISRKDFEISLVGISQMDFTLSASAAIQNAFAGVAVQNQSNAQITAAVSGLKYGAVVGSVEITGAALDYGGTGLVATSGKIPLSGTQTYNVKVTDSRGTVKTTTVNVAVTAYAAPVFTSVITQRTNSSGQVLSDGTYASGKAVVAASPIPATGTNQNTITGTLQFREKGTSAWTTVANGFTSNVAKLFGGSLAIAKVYEVLYTVSDAFSTVTYQDTISVASFIMAFKRGGSGVAVGKDSDLDGFDVGWPVRFRAGITFDIPPIWYTTATLPFKVRATGTIALSTCSNDVSGSGTPTVGCLVSDRYGSIAEITAISGSNATIRIIHGVVPAS